MMHIGGGNCSGLLHSPCPAILLRFEALLRGGHPKCSRHSSRLQQQMAPGVTSAVGFLSRYLHCVVVELGAVQFGLPHGPRGGFFITLWVVLPSPDCGPFNSCPAPRSGWGQDSKGIFHDTDQREIPDFTTANFQDTWVVVTIPLADTFILSQQGGGEVGARSPSRQFSVTRGVAWLVFWWIF